VTTYPRVYYLKEVSLPHDGVRRCGSSGAHDACRFAGQAHGYLLTCDASARAWSHCPYHATGSIRVPAVQEESGLTS
jgi:hypothetical protein